MFNLGVGYDNIDDFVVIILLNGVIYVYIVDIEKDVVGIVRVEFDGMFMF